MLTPKGALVRERQRCISLRRSSGDGCVRAVSYEVKGGSARVSMRNGEDVLFPARQRWKRRRQAQRSRP